MSVLKSKILNIFDDEPTSHKCLILLDIMLIFTKYGSVLGNKSRTRNDEIIDLPRKLVVEILAFYWSKTLLNISAQSLQSYIYFKKKSLILMYKHNIFVIISLRIEELNFPLLCTVTLQ